MIFKQVDEILSGRKTQTRRVCKPTESALMDVDGEICWGVAQARGPHTGYIKWAEGRTYAVVPKRGMPAMWWHELDGVRYCEEPVYNAGYDLKAYYMQNGWQPMRIRITAIRQERVQDITEADAQAEGVASVEEYRDLWESINGKTKSARWSDNPDVWVLTFEVVK